MFSKIVLVCFLAALVLAEQDLDQQLDKGEKQQQQDTLVRRTVNKNIVDYTERVQQKQQPLWQQYKPTIEITRDSEGVQKIVRLPGNPFFQGVRVNVKPYPGGYVAIRTNGAEIVKPFTATPDTTEKDEEIIIESQTPEEQLQEQIRQQQQLQGQFRQQQQLQEQIRQQQQLQELIRQQQLQQQIIQQQQQQQQQRGYQRFFNPQAQEYLTRYPVWSRFLQPQQQQQIFQQENPFGEYYRQTGEEQGENDRAVRDTKKDKKSKDEKLQEQKQKDEREGLNRVPMYYQQYQRMPYQIYDDQQQQFYQQQQGPYTNQLLNRLLGYQQFEQQYPYYQQQYPYYQQQYQLPGYVY